LGWAFLQLFKIESILTERTSLLWGTIRQVGLTGLLFGFAFVARPQIALGLVGLAIVLLWRRRSLCREHFILLGGFIIATMVGVILDRIGYGNWVLTPYRYFTVNLVEGVAATFNPYPWYQYFLWIVQLLPLISIPLFLGWMAYLRHYPLDSLSAFTASFFAFHLFITNKEYRFLFPILILGTVMAAVGLQHWYQRQQNTRRLPLKGLFAAYVLVSVIAFAFSALRPASILTLWAPETYLRHHQPHDVWISNHHFEISDHVAYYDLRHQVQPRVVGTLGELNQAIAQASHRPIQILLDGGFEDVELIKMKEHLTQLPCSVVARAIPEWLENLRHKLTFINKLGSKTLYQCFQ
jgi:hypothetical protein